MATLRYHHEGQRFGSLVALRHSGGGYWFCRCDCGEERDFYGTSLRSGRSISCGCSYKHHMAKTPTWRSWSAMRERCNSPNHHARDNYGGRGIQVCPQWDSFKQFYADMGKRPSKAHTIDRIDNDGDYTPENCRWATKSQQSRNRRIATLVTHNGETLNLCAWAKRAGIPRTTLGQRIRAGWDIDRALSEPVRQYRSR